MNYRHEGCHGLGRRLRGHPLNEVETYARSTTTKSINLTVTFHYLWILRFNSQTPVVLGVLHDVRKRFWYRTPYQLDNQPSFEGMSLGVGRRQG